MKKWYATQMMIENTFGNSFTELSKHLAFIKTELGGSIGMGVDRFSILSHECCPAPEELVEIGSLMQQVWKAKISDVSVAVIDESVIGYQPSQKTLEKAEAEIPIPVVYIPRKPHPNGLECFLAATYVQDPNSDGNLPYIISMVPHVVVQDYSNAEAAMQIINNWTSTSYQPHWVVDAGFGSMELLELSARKGGGMTASFSENQLGDLWDALSFSLPPGHWRAAFNNQGYVASVHCGLADGKKRAIQHCMCSNWTVEGSPDALSSSDGQPANNDAGQRYENDDYHCSVRIPKSWLFQCTITKYFLGSNWMN